MPQWEFEERNSNTWLSLNIRLWRRSQLVPPFLFLISLPRVQFHHFSFFSHLCNSAEPYSFTQKPIYCSFSKQRGGFKHNTHLHNLQLLSTQHRFLRDKSGPIWDSPGLSFTEVGVSVQRNRILSPLLSKLPAKDPTLTCTSVVPFASGNSLTALWVHTLTSIFFVRTLESDPTGKQGSQKNKRADSLHPFYFLSPLSSFYQYTREGALS